MRRFLMLGVTAVLAGAVVTESHASRCVDQVALFAQRLDVSIGAPGEAVLPVRNSELASENNSDAEQLSASVPVSAGSVPLARRAMDGASPDFGGSAGGSFADKDEGTALKAQARSVLSNLLNAALAAGEEGQSRACFKQLNMAHAVLQVTAPDLRTEDHEEWR